MSRIETERVIDSSRSTHSNNTHNNTHNNSATTKVTSSASASAAKNNVLDRTKKCPMLVRIFCRNGGHHRLNEFTASTCTSNSGLPIDDELTIYTW